MSKKSKSKHTPGPWRVHHPAGSSVVCIRGNGLIDVVPWLGFDESSRTVEEHLANARIMAASPRLLTVCEMVLEWAQKADDQPNGNFTYFADVLVPMLDEVIVQAKGGDADNDNK